MNISLRPPRLSRRNQNLLVAHLLIFVLAYLLAVSLRFDFRVPLDEWGPLARVVPVFLLVKLVVFHWCGAFNGWWRYLTFADLADLLKAATVSLLAVGTISYAFASYFEASRAVLILDYGATILLLGGLRASCRLLQEQFLSKATSRDARRALILGANRSGEMVVRQINGNGRKDYRVVGYLDENEACHGSRLGGVPVLGGPADVKQLAQRADAEVVLIAANTMPGAQVRQLTEDCGASGLAVKMIPSVEDIISGQYRFQTRDVSIDDLLHREPVELDNAMIADFLRGRRVLVTGAGGSIGSEMCRQIVKFQPESLILVERYESGLFFIHRELKSLAADTDCVPCVADILNKPRMKAIFETYQPEVVFHAAAHKHVPMMEDNPGEAINNNVFGTKCVVDLAVRHGVRHFVMISTDKAVNPTSIMGVSKHLAERYVNSLADTSKTKCVSVRFGNVLGSVGSVVPLFQEQIRRGGPVTVTDPSMTRFFMTIPEASQLVLQAAAMGKGGEIFVLDMGEPVKIVDLARDMIRLSGFTLDQIEIQYVGTRPGEKLYEELSVEDEHLLPTSHPKVLAAYHRPFYAAGIDWIRELRAVNGSRQLLWQTLRKLVPEYHPPGAPAEPLAAQATKETICTAIGDTTTVPTCRSAGAKAPDEQTVRNNSERQSKIDTVGRTVEIPTG